MNPLTLAVTLFAAGPFIGNEERIAAAHIPSDITVVRSADATLLAWREDSRVRARMNDTTADLGTGTDVRAATDGRDFQIIWVDQQRILGALWSRPADVKTLVNLNAFPGSQYRSPALLWNGRTFQVFAGYDPVDDAALLDGVVLTVTASSAPEHQECRTARLPNCVTVPASYRIDWRVRQDNSATKVFSNVQGGYTSTHPPSVAASDGEFLIVWKSSIAVEGIRVRRDGSTAGFIHVPAASPLSGRRGPKVAWDGTRYLIVFDILGESSDIWGAFVVPGQNYVAEPFVIAGSAEQEITPAVTAIGPDRFLVAYAAGNNAIGTRVVSFKEPPPSRRRAIR